MATSTIRLVIASSALFLIGIPALATADLEIAFEGYRPGQGTPEGGTIISVAAGSPDPWFGSLPYQYIDGWNHGPRVPSNWYEDIWASGGHAATGVQIEDWTSLDATDPGRYVLDYQGYQYDYSFFYDSSQGYQPGDPEYGHEDRWYNVMTGGNEGTWEIFDTTTSTTVVHGTLDDPLHVDIFYDPENFGTQAFDPRVVGTGTLTALDDGGVFYSELMTLCETPVLTMQFITEEPPLWAENYGAPSSEQWAVFSGSFTLGECDEPAQQGDDDTSDDDDDTGDDDVGDDDASDDDDDASDDDDDASDDDASPADDDSVEPDDNGIKCSISHPAGASTGLAVLLIALTGSFISRRRSRV